MDWLKKIFFALSKKERITLFSILGAIVVAGLAYGVFYLAISTKATPAYGGTFVEGAIGQPSYINPVIAFSNADKNLVRLTFSNLKDLSDNITTENGGKVWKVRLKENISWSDGQRITSDDVVFTITKIQDQNTNSPLLGSWQGVSVRRNSQIELIFELANPYAFFNDNLLNLYILPKHIFEGVPVVNWKLSKYNLEPIGSGPFIFNGYDKKENGFIKKYKLKSNDKYFGQKPYIDNFEIAYFSNTEEVIRNFNSGSIDGMGDIDPKSLKSIRRSYREYSFETPNYYAIFMNQSESLPLQDKEVRKALTDAINQDELIEKVFAKKAEKTDSPIPPSFKDISRHSVELGNAVEILEKAGWKVGALNIREKSINSSMVPLEFELVTPEIPLLVETAEYIKSSWEKIGIKAEIRRVAPGQDLDNTIKNRGYDMILLGNALNSEGDLFSFWHSSERFHPGLNLSLYSNKDADATIESIRQSMNQDERRKQFEKLQKIIADDYPAIFLFSPNYIYVAGKSLKGIEPGFIANPSDRFLNVFRWHVKTARVLK